MHFRSFPFEVFNLCVVGEKLQEATSEKTNLHLCIFENEVIFHSYLIDSLVAHKTTSSKIFSIGILNAFLFGLIAYRFDDFFFASWLI